MRRSKIVPLSLLLVALNGLAWADGFDDELEEEPPKPHKEDGPSDIDGYKKNDKTPRFIRINVRGQSVRTSPEFDAKNTANIEFTSRGGEVLAVESVQHLAQGTAVQVHVDNELRWIYVPHARKDDFQLCESEACFSALADSLDFFMRGSSVSTDQARSCGVGAGPEGLILPVHALYPQKELGTVRAEAVSAPRVFKMTVKPLWEQAKGAKGVNWTRLMSNALDKNGQGLLKRNSLSDSRMFCPNFSKLSPAQKKEFYIHLFNGIARYESNFKTSSPVFDEKRYANRTPPYNIYSGPIKPRAYSMGLFQLSYSAAPGYRPQCRIDYEKDRGKDISDPSLTIYDPQIQMECAVAIMNKWVSKDGGIGLTKDISVARSNKMRFRGGANYWSTLRNTNPATRELIASLKRFTPCWR